MWLRDAKLWLIVHKMLTKRISFLTVKIVDAMWPFYEAKTSLSGYQSSVIVLFFKTLIDSRTRRGSTCLILVIDDHWTHLIVWSCSHACLTEGLCSKRWNSLRSDTAVIFPFNILPYKTYTSLYLPSLPRQSCTRRKASLVAHICQTTLSIM